MDKIVMSMKMFTFFANRNTDVKSMLQDLSSAIYVDVRDGSSFYVKLDGGKISIRSGKPEKSDATIKTQKATLQKIISGKLSQEDAFNKKIIETSGSIMDAMRFRHVLNITLEKSFGVRLLRSTIGRFM
jgi:putative sterol carrier protein